MITDHDHQRVSKHDGRDPRPRHTEVSTMVTGHDHHTHFTKHRFPSGRSVSTVCLLATTHASVEGTDRSIDERLADECTSYS
eukprot:6672163-Prymnesium_polylepis.1